MSFSINISGHLTDDQATQDDIQEVFENTIRALRAIGADPTGSCAGTENNQPFTFNSADVTDEEAADTDATDDSDEPAATTEHEDNDGEA